MIRIFIGSVATLLSMICLIGGYVFARYRTHDFGLMILGYTFWILPFMTAFMCFLHVDRSRAMKLEQENIAQLEAAEKQQ